MSDYADFLARKAQLSHMGGFYESVRLGRYGIGCELKPSYYQQAVRNLAAVDEELHEEPSLLDELEVM